MKCYLSDDFSKYKLSAEIVICPEGLKNGKKIIEWVANLKSFPCDFATNSLFLLRELYLQQIPITVINLTEAGVREADNIDDVGNIEIVDRELEQSDRYINLKT